LAAKDVSEIAYVFCQMGHAPLCVTRVCVRLVNNGVSLVCLVYLLPLTRMVCLSGFVYSYLLVELWTWLASEGRLVTQKPLTRQIKGETAYPYSPVNGW